MRCRLLAKEGIFTLYRGDEFIDVGTLTEMAKRNNIRRKTLSNMRLPGYRERHKNYENRLCCYKVDEIDPVSEK